MGRDTNGTMIPGARYKDAPAAIEWLCNTFGFEKHLVIPGENNTIIHSQLTLRYRTRRHRFVVDTKGVVLARGADDGASWVKDLRGSIKIVDLDLDGNSEIIVLRNKHAVGPGPTSDVLEVYVQHGAKLNLEIELVLNHNPDFGSKARCTGSHKLIKQADGKTTIHVEAKLVDFKKDSGPVRPSILRAIKPRQMEVTCLASGSYQYRLGKNGFTVDPPAP